MSKFFSIVALALASLSFVAAGSLKLCNDNGQSGHCKTIDYTNNQCVNLPSDLEDEVSSVNPVGSGHKCFLYVDQGCTGDHFDFQDHHNSLPDEFNDAASSFYCEAV